MSDFVKLIGAFLYLALAIVFTVFISFNATAPDTVPIAKYLTLILACILGWRFLGSSVGYGLFPSMSTGLLGTVILVLLAFLLQSVQDIFWLSLQSEFSGMFEALTSVFVVMQNTIDNVSSIIFWSTVLVGGIVSGLLVEIIWRIWR